MREPKKIDGPDTEIYLRLLSEATEASRAHRVADLEERCRAMVALLPRPNPALETGATTFIKELRNNRRYDQIQRMGEAYIKAGYTTPRIWTIYAQAMVDRGNQVTAAALVSSLLATERTPELVAELPEIYGIRARAWKDIGYEAINFARRDIAIDALKRAYEDYARGLETAPEKLSLLCWQGTQMVAVAHMARVNELDFGVKDDKGAFAKRILAAAQRDVDANGVGDPWTLAAAGEMSVALGDLPGATVWYKRFIGAPRITTFDIASTHRQLTQIWKIGATEEGAKLEALLLSAVAERGGGFALTRGDVLQLQAQIGRSGPIGMRALEAALRAAKSVAMILRQFAPTGTGFVVDAKSLGLEDIGKVVVTNAHVVSEPPEHNAARPRDIQVAFQGLGTKEVWTVKRIVASLAVDTYDCSVLELVDPIPADLKPLTLGDMPDELPDDPTACVIGHPLGQEVSFSFLDGELVDFDRRPRAGKPQRMHYRSPTEMGSSGSPVFNKNWQVIGIHRAYHLNAPALNGLAGTYAANEGISMTSIVAAFTARSRAKSKPSVRPPRRSNP